PAGSRGGRLVVARNSGWQLVTFTARAVSGLAAVILVARHGGPAQLGVFQFALTLSQMFSFAVGLGLFNLLTREVAREPRTSRAWIEAGVFVALAAGGLVSALLGVGVRLAGQGPDIVEAVTLAGLALAFDTAGRISFAAFAGWERMGLESVATCLQEGLFLAGVPLALDAGLGVRGVLLAYVGSRLCGALAGWLMACRELRAVMLPRPHIGFLRPTLRRTIPFALDDAMSLTYIRVDSVILGFVKGPTAVGLYQAGTNLVLYLNVLARVLNTALYPRMSRAWPNPRQLGRYRDVSLRLLGSVGVPIMVGSLLLAPSIFRFVYGSKFDKAVLTYQVLVLVIPIRMLGHTLGTALTAADGQTRRTVAVAAAAAANFGLNVWFIPRYSYLGAAITTAITESGLFVTYGLLLRRLAGRSALASSLAVPALASLPMAALLLAFGHGPLLLLVAAGALVYAGAVLAIALATAPSGARRRPRAALTALVSRPAPR
ncbi:MAG TPA: flippase, partial [Actinomycetota bacterium]|nr:flippase [Actinomycetota bacterium]